VERVGVGLAQVGDLPVLPADDLEEPAGLPPMHHVLVLVVGEQRLHPPDQRLVLLGQRVIHSATSSSRARTAPSSSSRMQSTSKSRSGTATFRWSKRRNAASASRLANS